MNRKALVIVFALAVLLLTSFAVVNTSRPAAPAAAIDNALSDYWQRHPSVAIPVTGIQADLRNTDYAVRHPELSAILTGPLAASDYWQRHPQSAVVISARAPAADLTDYAARHPGMTLAATRQIDTTDYYFRQLINR